MGVTSAAEGRFEAVAEDRYDEWVDQVQRVFGYPPVEDDENVIELVRSVYRRESLIAADDGSGYIATAAGIDVELMLPGSQKISGLGLTGMAVDSTARRQGLLHAMVENLHRRAVEREIPVAVLIPSEWPIYGRFGYGPTMWYDSLAIEAKSLGWCSDSPGRVVGLRKIAGDEAKVLAQELYTQRVGNTPGEIEPPASYWNRFTVDPAYSRLDMMLGLASNDDSVRRCVAVADRGIVAYRLKSGWSSESTPTYTLEVTDLLSTDREAEGALWRHVLSVDLVTEVRVARHPVDHPLRWWVSDARRLRPRRHDGLWLRPLNVATLLEAREWSGDGALTLSIHDEQGYASGAYRLEIDGGRASCLRTTRSDPDLEMDAAALGAIFLGGTSVRGLAEGGRVRARDHRCAQLWDSLATPARPPFLTYPF